MIFCASISGAPTFSEQDTVSIDGGTGVIRARGLNNSSNGTHCAIVGYEKEVFGPN